MTTFAPTAVPISPTERASRPLDASIVSSLGSEPWKSAWWKTAEGERPTFLYIVAIHILAVIGVIFFATPGWRIMVTTVALAWMGGLGVTVCYHRTLAHTALRLNPVVKHMLIFFAMFNGSGSPDSWTANHRQHHSKVETAEDISSPSIGGFWWAHLRWLWQAGKIPLDRWCPDLDKSEYRFWRRMQVPLLAVSLFGGLAFGLPAFFWLGPMRLVMSLHAQCFVNSIAHMREVKEAGEDSSQNVAWLALLHFFQGENWHGNHHAKPSSARFGWKLWQIDFGWYAIWMLELVGLATSVKRASTRGPSAI